MLSSNSVVTNGASNIHNDRKKPLVHIEILQTHNSKVHKEELTCMVDQFIIAENVITTDTIFKQETLPHPLKDHVSQIQLCEVRSSELRQIGIEVSNVDLCYHVYKIDRGGPAVEEMSGTGEEDIPAATHWLLPSAEFQDLWDTLIFDTDIKDQLINFVSTTLLFSDHNVNSNVISWNRVLLLHGPPGTGKTSLCKALAQKISIRLGSRYKYGQLFEVNSHSLFSKWFSESGKLVQKLFSKITELVEDPDSLVCVLIDEVESLTRMRDSNASGSDPSDALRVVNALLTQLDQIKRYPNVLILTTSNVSGTIDLAFVDRADIKQYIGLPSQEAIFQIYVSCILELMNAKIIVPKSQLMSLHQLKIINMTDNHISKHSLLLWKIAEESSGLSGRSLRKIPFLAHALHVHTETCTLSEFLEAMTAAVHKHQMDSAKLKET